MKNAKVKISKESLIIGMILLLGAFIPVFLMSKCSPLYPFNDWYDINQYFSVGKGILYGKVPYRDLMDQKGPFLYLLGSIAYLIDRTGFFGWFVLEVLDLFVFSVFSYKTLRLFYPDAKSVIFVMPFVCCLTALSSGFQHGGSAEELSLWIFAIALYSMMKMLKDNAGTKPGIVLINGILFGLLFWTKFSMTGIYIVWVIWLCFFVKGRKIRDILMFPLGFICSTLPWIIYFGLNHSIRIWLDSYIFDNVFGYGKVGSKSFAQLLAAIIGCLGKFLLRRTNLPILLLLCLVIVFCLIPNKKTGLSISMRVCIILMMVMTTLGVYAGGFDYGYYGLVLVSYMSLGFLPMIGVAEFLRDKISGHKSEDSSEKKDVESDAKPLESKTKPVENIILFAVAALAYLACVIFSFKHSDNTYMIGTPKETLPQYVFADIINSAPEDERVLLNYGFLDAGVYTVLDQVPQMQYFVSVNSDYDNVLKIQSSYVRDGIPDFVLTFYPVDGSEEEISDVVVLKDDYHVVKYIYYYIEGGYRTYVLWEKNR